MSVMPTNESIQATDKSGRLAAAVALAQDGQFLNALVQLEAAGSLREWSGADRTQVSWIVRELGAPRLARWHVLKAYREEPESIFCSNAYATDMLEYLGPLETLHFAEKLVPPRMDDDPTERLHRAWLFAITHILVKDFSTAERWIESMEAIGERPEMCHFVRAHWLETQDRYDEACAAIDRSLQIKLGRRAVQYKSHLLTLHGRDDEAYQLLVESDATMQVAAFSWQMAAISYERRDYADCARLLKRFESLSPLLQRNVADGFLLFRSELARRAGDDETAIAMAQRSRSARGRQIAQMLADPDRRNRMDVVLDVPFVRQHEMTCGPATLAALCQYWQVPVEHLEVAEEICYAGTTTHAERVWAERNGFSTAEFTVTESSTETLIGRGVPFTLVTRAPGMAHLQAVIGYDARTATALIRDPYHRTRGSVGIEELLKDQAAHGPRGMVMVPRDRADLIADLELPDARLHDLLHQFDGALISHNREEAAKVLVTLQSIAPENRITLQAARQMGLYDANESEMLSAVEKLLAQYPDDVTYQMSEISLLGTLGRQKARVERLKALVASPMAHPLLILQLGESLALDGRHRDEAESLLRESIRKAPSYARGYCELADLVFMRGRRDEALRLYRFAACLEETDEYLAMRYFDAASVLGKSADVLRWIRNRFEKFGHKSMQPTVTLVSALLRGRQHDEAVEVLNEAMRRRTNDADLQLFVAQTLADTSSEHWDTANQLVEQTKGIANERSWRHCASHLALLRGDLTEARDHLLQLQTTSPMLMSLHESISDLTRQIDGSEAAIEHWRAAAEQFPHHQPLQEAYAMSLRERPLNDVRPVLEQIIERNPDNAWAHRELAQHLLSAGQLDAAETEISKCEELDHEHSFVLHLKATLAHRRGNSDEARQYLRSSLERDVNDDYAAGRLVAFCKDLDETRQELQWLFDRLRKETLTGDVLLTVRDLAEPVMPAVEVLAAMREAYEARRDLWQSHQALIRQLTHMGHLEEAAQVADAATRQFPLEPSAWFERYQVAIAAGDRDKQRELLLRLQMLRHGNVVVMRALAELDSAQGRYDEARRTLEELVAKSPLDPVNRGYLGDCLLELKEHELALEQFERAARLAPEYDFAWNMTRQVATQLERVGVVESVARELTQTRPHETAAWLVLADELADADKFDEACRCLDMAEKIDPYRESIHTRRARFRVRSGDYTGALAALQPDVYAEVPGSLVAHRAQLMWELGQQDAAYELIQKTANEDPAFLGAWGLLEQWAIQRGDRTQAIAAVDHRVSANPHDPDNLDAAAGSLVDLEEIPRAISLYQRAIEIAPQFTGSRCKLFDLLIDKEDYDSAESVVTGLTRLNDHPVIIARRMMIQNHRKDQQGKRQSLRAILDSMPIDGWAIGRAIELMVEGHESQELLSQIEAAIERLIKPRDEGVYPAATEDEMERSCAVLGQSWGQVRRDAMKEVNGLAIDAMAADIQGWMSGDELSKDVGRGGHSILVQHLGSLDDLSHFRRYVEKYREWMFTDLDCWSATAFTLANTPPRFKKSEMQSWLSDWQTRFAAAEEGLVKPWMFTNVHELLRLTGQEDDARSAVVEALSLPADHMRSQLALWAAHDALVLDDSRRAIQCFMQAASVEHLQGMDRILHIFVESVLHVQQSENRAIAFTEVKRQFQNLGLAKQFYKDQPVYLPVYLRTLRLIAQSVGTLSAKWWAFQKTVWQKL